MANVRNHWPPNFKFEFLFERNPDRFILQGSERENTSYLIELEDISLSLDRLEPSPAIAKWYTEKLKAGLKPRIPIDRSVIKTYIVNANKSDLSHYNIISGHQLPDQILIGVVTENSYNGSITTNPYNFKDWDIREASILVNGVHEPQELYKMNKSESETADIWNQFLNNSGVKFDDRYRVSQRKMIH